MRRNILTSAAVVFFGCAVMAGCGGGSSTTLIPAANGPQTLRLTFADFHSAAQSETVVGSNASLASGSCAVVTRTGPNTFSVAPVNAGVNACFLVAKWSNSITTSEAEVHVGIGVSLWPGQGTTFIADASPNNYTEVAQSYSTSVVTVANGGNGTVSGRKFAFKLTGVATGNATLGISCSGCAGSPADDWDVPITVGQPSASPSPSASPTATPSASPTATPTPAGNSFTLTNASTQTFTLSGSAVGAQISFFGQVTIAGASSENVIYVETAGLPSNGCAVSGTIVDAIALTFPQSFSFVPNGSAGPNTGLLDTTFSPPSPSGTYYGTIYQAGSCTTPFSAAAQAFAGAPYEYPGGGNTSVPAGTYILELWH